MQEHNQVLNNFIHHKHGNKQWKINKQQHEHYQSTKHNRQRYIRMCPQIELSTELYEAKKSLLICLNEQFVIQILAP